MQFEKLVEFKREKGHCKVSQTKHKDDNSLAEWVTTQRSNHTNNKIRPDRKRILDEIEFVWKADRDNDRLWHQQYEKLVEYKQKKWPLHCAKGTRAR
jgi:hypothetical protein